LWSKLEFFQPYLYLATKNPNENMKATPATAPTAIPAFAPLERPDDSEDAEEAEGGGAVGERTKSVDVDEVTWDTVDIIVETVRVASVELRSAPKVAAILRGLESQQLSLVPQHHFSEVGNPSQGVIATFPS
jgi:hypothetical protein